MRWLSIGQRPQCPGEELQSSRDENSFLFMRAGERNVVRR